MACLLQSKVFICGGGSLLQNATGNLSLGYYLGLLWLARLCGCKTRLMSSGIGPIEGEIARRLTVWTLRGCEQMEVRDRASEIFLLEHGLERERIRLAPDAASQLKIPPPSRLTFIKRELGLVQGRRYFCVVVRRDEHPFGACLGKLSAALRLFLRETDLTPVFVLFDKKRDLDATKRVCRGSGGVIFYPHEARDALSVISGAQFLVSMRLHALVFASMTGRRAIAISPFEEETKLSSFCREKGMTHLSPSRLTVAGAFDAIVKLGARGGRR
jgi:polysaccharide pyruvyl transferase WcaK-like protein